MPKMVAVVPILIEVSEQPGEAELKQVSEALDASLDAANAVNENVEFVGGMDERYTNALVQGTMAHLQAAAPEVVAHADAAMQALSILGGGEEKLN